MSETPSQPSFLRYVTAVLGIGSLLGGSTLQGAVLNSAYTFGTNELGNNGNWAANDGSVVFNSGPNGFNDNALGYVSSAGEGFHLFNAYNPTYLGNYEAIGAYAIEFDARFISGSAVSLRAYLLDPTPMGWDNDHFAVSSQVIHLSSADTDWHHYVVSIAPEDVVVVQNSYPRTNITQVGLRHDPNGDGPGFPDVVSTPTTVYFDNIALTAAPEPHAVGFMILGGVAMLSRTRFRRRD